jgi:hypothetical protein
MGLCDASCPAQRPEAAQRFILLNNTVRKEKELEFSKTDVAYSERHESDNPEVYVPLWFMFERNYDYR